MNRIQLTTTLLLALGLAACGEPAPRPGTPVSAETPEARLRRDFQEVTARRIDDIDRQLQELRVKARNADAATRERLAKLGDELAVKKEQAAADLRSLGGVISDKWDVAKRKLESALDDIERGIRDALS